MRRLLDAWDRFWFAAVDARSVGLMRILLGILLLVSHLSLFWELDLLFGQGSDLVLATRVAGGKADRGLYGLVEDPASLPLLHGVLTLPILLFTLGLGGRIPGLLTLLIQISLLQGNPWMLHGGDRLLRLWTLSLLLVPCTRALSLDALLARWRGRPLPATVPVTAHRLVQLQLMLMYLMTGLTKLQGSRWRNGEALYYALSVEHFQRFPGLLDPYLATGWGQVLASLGTWTTLGWELAFPLLVLHPRSRWPALGVGVLLHAGIALFMMVGSFSYAAVWGYLAFWMPGSPRSPRSPPTPDPAASAQSAGPVAPAAPA